MIKLPSGAALVKQPASNKGLPAGNKQARSKMKGIINEVRAASADIKTQTAADIAAYLMDPQAWKAKGNRCFLNPSFASQRGITADSLTIPLDHVWQPGDQFQSKEMTTTITRDPMRAIIQKYVYSTPPLFVYASGPIQMVNLFEGNLGYAIPSPTTVSVGLDIHGSHMIPGYDGDQFWYQVGGMKVSLKFQNPVGQTVIHYQIRSGSQNSAPEKRIVNIGPTDTTVDFDFSQSAGYTSLTYFSCWLGDDAPGYGGNTFTCTFLSDQQTNIYYGARPLPYVLNDPTITSVRIESGTMWYSNTAPEIEKSGELASYQCAKGEATEKYFSYSKVAAASGSSNQKLAALGRFSRLRNSEPSNLDMVNIYRDGTPVYSFGEYKDALTRTIKIKNLVGTEGTTQYSFAIEFVSSNQLYTTEIPIQDYEVSQIVYTILTHSEWDFENPMHLKDIAKNIARFGKKAVDKVVDLMPKIADFTVRYGPAIAKGLATVAAIL